MQKTVLRLCRFAPVVLLLSSLTGVAVAQKKAPKAPSTGQSNEVNVRIIERNGNDVREIERTYRIDGMSDPERDKMVTRLVDSLKATRKGSAGKQQLTIIVEDNDGDRVVTRQRSAPGARRLPGDREVYVQRGRIPRTNNDAWNSQNWRYEFRRGADSLADQLNRFHFQMPRDWDRQFARPFEDWSRNFNGKPSTIRGLDVFPNNPDREQLNIRFTAPAKGNVTILVTNTKGKEVARREINDFSGEFVGQIDIGKKGAGTYFVTVTQNEDGAVKRVSVE